MWLKSDKVNNKITTKKIAATNNEEVVPTSSVVQLALFRKMQSTNYNILVHTGTGTFWKDLKIIWHTGRAGFFFSLNEIKLILKPA